MGTEESSSKPINFDRLIDTGKERCSENLKNIEDKLSRFNKLEIISRLSILTQTQIGRQSIEGYHISDLPCLHFILGLALKTESCADIEPSTKDIDEILKLLGTYFLNFFSLLRPDNKGKDDDVIFHAQMHALIGQLNPEKYPFQMIELLLETFGQLDDYFTQNYGFTITDAIEFSDKITQHYENSINLKKENVQKKYLTDIEIDTEFYFKIRELLEIVPEEFCKVNDCDIRKFEKYLTAFSCNFGEGNPTYNSPLDENLFHKKPILHENERFFVPIPQDLFQKLPLIFEYFLEKEKLQSSIIWQTYQETKAKFTEKKVTEYLERIFKKDGVYENLFYTIKKGRTAEVDHIIPYFDNVLIIESKSGNFSITAKREGITRIETTLKRLISDAHKQGIRTKEFIKNKKPAIFTDSNGKKKLEVVYKKNQTHFILINVTLEHLLSFSSNLKNIESLGIFSKSEYPWSVNLFELDIITRHIDSPAIFIHYIEKRLKAQDDNLFLTFDELSFLGFYLEWGNFNIYLEDGTNPTKIHLEPEFLEGFDQYYLYGGDRPELKIEKGIKKIINELEQLRADGFTNITNALLDLDHPSREHLIKSIEKICNLTKNDGKRHSFSAMFRKNEIGIAVFSQKGRENLSAHLSLFCQLKKYQCQADFWIGFGIDILDSDHVIKEYIFYDTKWKQDNHMDQTVEWALKEGLIQS